MSVRVIAGTAKGRKLTSVDHPGVRPSGDKVKGAMFSSIGPEVVGARVLDLYSGSGALGIEALSRGAAHAVFVESDRAAAAAIRRNLEVTRLDVIATVVESAVEDFLSTAGEGPFDLVLLDPPYASGPPIGVLGSLRAKGLVRPGGRVTVETSARQIPFAPPEGFEVIGSKRYGEAALVHLRVVDADRA